ncbi:MAG: FixH family protein [Proteobacteria bacterium]|nr:FixH family protein [Pseudomonadota bacterium]
MSMHIDIAENATAVSQPWYRHPWVWFVFCVPFSAVAFGIVMFVSANTSPDDLVVDDYYKEGMGINQLLQQDGRAREMSAAAEMLVMTPDGLVMSVAAGSDQLVLSAYHVTDRSKDLTVPLNRIDDRYTAQSAALSTMLSQPGVWYLEIRDPLNGWRLRQRVESPLASLRMVPDE